MHTVILRYLCASRVVSRGCPTKFSTSRKSDAEKKSNNVTMNINGSTMLEPRAIENESFFLTLNPKSHKYESILPIFREFQNLTRGMLVEAARHLRITSKSCALHGQPILINLFIDRFVQLNSRSRSFRMVRGDSNQLGIREMWENKRESRATRFAGEREEGSPAEFRRAEFCDTRYAGRDFYSVYVARNKASSALSSTARRYNQTSVDPRRWTAGGEG